MNADDDQRADDLEGALDEGDVGRASKMASKWSTSNAEVAIDEVQRRNDAHRRDVEGSASDAGEQPPTSPASLSATRTSLRCASCWPDRTG